MTPAELLAAMRDRGVHVGESDGRLVVRPASGLSDEEVAFLREHATEVLAALRAPAPRDELTVEVRSTLDELLAEEERRAAERARATYGRTERHYWSADAQAHVGLAWLTVRDVRRLESRGTITPDQVREWFRVRQV